MKASVEFVTARRGCLYLRKPALDLSDIVHQIYARSFGSVLGPPSRHRRRFARPAEQSSPKIAHRRAEAAGLDGERAEVHEYCWSGLSGFLSCPLLLFALEFFGKGNHAFAFQQSHIIFFLTTLEVAAAGDQL